jgi:hypothetical protein
MIRFAPADAVPAPKARRQEVAQPEIKIAAAVAAPAKTMATPHEEPAQAAAKPAAELLALTGEETPKTRKARKAPTAGKRATAAKSPEADVVAPLLLELQA